MKHARVPKRAAEHMIGMHLPEVSGKTIKSLEIASDNVDVRYVTITFTDDTELAIEVLILPTLLLETKLYVASTAKIIKTRKDYLGPRPEIENIAYSDMYPHKKA